VEVDDEHERGKVAVLFNKVFGEGRVRAEG
jgi:hypothetical protein